MTASLTVSGQPAGAFRFKGGRHMLVLDLQGQATIGATANLAISPGDGTTLAFTLAVARWAERALSRPAP